MNSVYAWGLTHLIANVWAILRLRKAKKLLQEDPKKREQEFLEQATRELTGKDT